MEYLKQSTAATVKLGPCVDDTDGKTAETALSIAQADIRLSKNGGDFAQTNNAAGATHDENGYYDVPLDTTDTNTLGRLKVAISKSGALPVWKEFLVLSAKVYDSIIAGSDNLEVDLVQILGAAVNTGAAQLGVNAVTVADKTGFALTSAYDPAKTAASQTSVDDIHTDVADVHTDVGTVITNLADVHTDVATVDGVADAIKTQTDKLAFTGSNVNAQVKAQDNIDFGALQKTSLNNATPAVTVSDKTGFALTAAYDAAKTAASQTSVTDIHTDVGTAITNIADVHTDVGTAITNIATVDGVVDAIKAKTDSLAFTGGNVNAHVKAKDNIDFGAAEKTSLNAATPAVTVSDKTGFSLTSAYDPAKTAATQASVDDVHADIATVASYVDTEVAAVKAVTDKLNTALVQDGAEYRFTANALELAPSGEGLTAGEIADAVWNEVMGDHQTSGTTGAALSAAGSAGDPWETSLPGQYGPGTAGKIIGDNLNAPVATVDTVVDAIKTQTDKLTFTGSNVNAQTKASDNIDFTAAQKTSLNAATPAVTVSDKTGFALTAAYDAAKSAAPTGAKMDIVDAPNATARTAIATSVWAAGTRTLTSFGTLISDIWGNASRTLSDKTGFALTAAYDKAKNAAAAGDKMDIVDAPNATGLASIVAAVWAAGSRTLTGFGTLVSDIWGNATRTLSDKSGFTLTSAYDPAKTAASQASVSSIPTNPVLSTDARLDRLDATVSSRLSAAAYTAPDNLNIVAMAAVVAKINTMLELDGAVYRLTINALENAPVTAAGPTAAQIADAVLDESLAAHQTEGSLGKAIATLDTSNSLTAEDVANMVLNAQLDDYQEAGSLGKKIHDITYTTGGDSDAIPWDYTLTNPDGGPCTGATVWVTSDIGGQNIIALTTTNDNGIARFLLRPGTVYVWCRKAGLNFENPDTEIVS